MEHWKDEHVTIASKRLLLLPVEENDAEDILKWINNEEVFNNFQFFTGKVSVEEELLYIRKMRDSSVDLLLGIFLEGEVLIGTCGLHEIDFNNDTARLGVIIGKKEYWNQGYAGEAIRALIKWAFSEMGLHKIYLNVFVSNERGVHLYTETGFKTEGWLRKEYKIRGNFVDMFRMAILKEEWESNNN